MKFQAGELSFNASVTDQHQTRSPQTGAALRMLTIQFRAPKPAMHELALETVRSHQPVYSTSDTGELDAEWRIADSDCAYIGTEPWGMHHHTWALQEVERIACLCLRLDGLELEPYEYTEQLGSDGALVLAARCAVSPEALLAVRDLRFAGLPLEVVRVGVSEEPRRMWLDDYVWGPCRHAELGLALRCQDAQAPQVGVTGTTVHEDIDTLLTLLHEVAVLDVADLEKLKQRRHAARQVDNVDSWPLDQPSEAHNKKTI